MACIKGVGRSASVALAPDAPYMAAGTMAGAVDLSFSSSANLEIFKLDFQSDDRDLTLVGEIPSSERFHRLAWGKTGSGSEEFSLGLIAGGLVDGNIDLWNPLSLIRCFFPSLSYLRAIVQIELIAMSIFVISKLSSSRMLCGIVIQFPVRTRWTSIGSQRTREFFFFLILQNYFAKCCFVSTLFI